MTSARFVRDLFRDQWGTGSINSPPEQPDIVEEGEADRRSVHTGDVDVIFCKDGGRPTIEAQSIGYREQYVEVTVDAEIITSVGREHLLGPPEDTYAGLEGEVRRILEEYRIGSTRGEPLPGTSVQNPGYDIIRLDTFDDQIGAVGADLWKGTWTFTFINYAKQIGQDATSH